ncbi:coenzyme F420 biosynthesis-associated protein, partial [Streptomyces sp. OUCMDZ-4982]|nr:coenzyme F420 biosynthesis-associated protein [Streptomyces sp. OUCMDZ-4982]
MTRIGGAAWGAGTLAAAPATRLVRPGPEISREDARAVVA